MNNPPRSRGFTIIELIVTITIISLLFAAASFSISTARKQGRDSRRLGDILLIAKSIDQASALTRGVLPKNANSVAAGSNATMCANEIIIEGANGVWVAPTNPIPTPVANPANLDNSVFPNRKFPHDPAAAVPLTSGCTGMINGYTYHTEYSHSIVNPATQQQVSYSLEVGLETTKPHDDSQFRSPSELPDLNKTTYPDFDSVNQRYRYFLNGPYCGTNCYGQ